MAYVNKGIMLIWKGDYDGAEACVREAVKGMTFLIRKSFLAMSVMGID